MANEEFLKGLEEADKMGIDERYERMVMEMKAHWIHISFLDEEGMTEYDVVFVEDEDNE